MYRKAIFIENKHFILYWKSNQKYSMDLCWMLEFDEGVYASNFDPVVGPGEILEVTPEECLLQMEINAIIENTGEPFILSDMCPQAQNLAIAWEWFPARSLREFIIQKNGEHIFYDALNNGYYKELEHMLDKPIERWFRAEGDYIPTAILAEDILYVDLVIGGQWHSKDKVTDLLTGKLWGDGWVEVRAYPLSPT